MASITKRNRLVGSVYVCAQRSVINVTQNKMKTFIIIIMMMMVYYLIIQLNEMTYVWQTTTFADFLTPITRKTCSIMNNNNNNNEMMNMKKRRIGMLLLYDDKSGDSTWSSSNELMTKVLANRMKYCKKYDYDLIVANEYLDSSRPAAWSKLIAVVNTMKKGVHDYIFYIDMDIVIMNMDKSIDDFIDLAISMNKDSDVIMTNDWNGPNTGVWISKNTEWSKWFLQQAWNQDHLVKKRSANGVPHPFEYEQRAFHFLLNTKKWSSRNLPLYRGNSSDIAKHITLLPQCAFNSYSLHPLDWRGSREESQYVQGDFIIHFAGKKGQIKVNLMEHYLGMANNNNN